MPHLRFSWKALEAEGNLMFEDLGMDKNKNQSSKPKIKSGPNKGFRHIEPGGKWKYIDGYEYSAPASEKYAHANWSKTLASLGYRIGKFSMEGVISFYVWMPE